MGEHADDRDRDDEESSASRTDDSPAAGDDARTEDGTDPDGSPDEERSAAADEGPDTDEEQADADEERGNADEETPEDADEAAGADDVSDDPKREKAEGVEPVEPLPSAEEWLADNPEYDAEPPDFADADSTDDDSVEDGGADDESRAADSGDDGSADVGSADDDSTDDEPEEDDGDSGSEADADDAVPSSERQARARAAADDRSPAEQDAELDLDDGAAAREDAEGGDGPDADGSDGVGADEDDEETVDDHAGDADEGDTADASDTDDADADDADADAAKTTTSVSTTDPGSNAPAGVGQPTPAGGGGGGTGTSGNFPDFDGEMAPDDQEQPLTEHIEEMTHRFLYVALVMGIVGVVALLWADDMINFLWYSFLGPDDGTCPGPACPVEWRPHVYHPLSLLIARLKMAGLVGFVAGLPVAVYETYRFMRPGLYPHERRYYLAAVPTSLVLAVSGVAFAYYVVLPSLFIYFSAYSTQAAELAFALSDTFNLMVMMLGFFAVIFQIPLLVMLAIMMGVTTRRWLEERRLYFWTGFGGVAFLFSPDPTGMAPLLVAVTMIALFEGTLLLLRWTERSVALFSAETMANNRPYAWALAAFVGYVLSAAPVPGGYFDQLPPVVVETLTDYGYVALTPALIAAAIVAVFEAIGWIARRVGAGQGRRAGLKVRLAFMRIRPTVWLLALVVGYMGSPNPVLLDIFREIEYAPPVAVGAVFGLIAAYEGLRLVLSYVRPE